MKLSLEQICQWMPAECPMPSAGEPHAHGDSTGHCTGYSIDSRTLAPGDLFFAIAGENFDGHDFVASALDKGATAAVVARPHAERYTDASLRRRLLIVDDPLQALQRLAASVRRHWGKRVIAVTGSAGKTTTKEAVAQVLSARFRVLKSQGNLNNHYGLPLQLLKLQPEDEMAVVEMGMSHAGEIAALAKIAVPNWGVVTNVGTAHAENFSDGQTGIARAKYELVAALPPAGMAFLNCDDEYVRQFGRDFHGTAIYFGTGDCADPRAESIANLGREGTRFTAVAGDRRVEVDLHLLGAHNVYNALAAIAVGLASGIGLDECASALASLTPPDKRGQTLEINGATIVNDCYNSNPPALRAMVDTLLGFPSKRTIVVAGEMLELGPDAAKLHRESGEYMGQRGVNIVIGVRGEAASAVAGAKSAGAAAIFLETPEEAGAWLKDNLRPGDAVLLKASRGVRLERALAILQSPPA